MDFYKLVKQDLDGLSEAGNLRHGEPLDATSKRDFLLRAYQKALEQVVLLRASLAQRDGK